MRRVAAILAVAGVCGAAFLLAGASDERHGRTYRIEFDNAFGLVPGGDVRVGGVNAGRTTGFDVVKRPGEAAKAVVEVELTERGFGDFRARRALRHPPPVADRRVLRRLPAGQGGRAAADGRHRPRRADRLDDPDRPRQRHHAASREERLRLIVTELGTGLAGRPDDLQQVLRRAHPGLRESSRTLRILGDQNAAIESFIADSDTVVSELEHKKRDVVRWIRDAGETAEITATRRHELRAGLRRLPVFLRRAAPDHGAARGARGRADPAAHRPAARRSLRSTLPRACESFAEDGRPPCDSLGDAAAVGNRAVRRRRAEMRELTRAGERGTGAFARPLRQLLGRRRAQPLDRGRPARRRDALPPPPIRRRSSDSGGFTGMEAIWNYFFWLTLSINMLRRRGHFLRASLTAAPDCTACATPAP